MKKSSGGLFVRLRLFGALTLLGSACLLVAWTSPAESRRLKVLTTIRPLYTFTAQVAGQAAEVENLLPPGVGPHDYSFTPTDAVRLHSADVLVVNGLGLETWMKGLLGAAGRPGLRTVDASQGVEPLPIPETGKHHDGEDVHGHEGRWDPHIWLDPIRAIRQVENIRDSLAAADPPNASIYAENAKRYIARLRSLHEEIKAVTAGFKQRELMTFHAAFQYFAHRYDLEVVAVIEPSPGREPTPKLLAHLHELAVRHKLKVIFTEPQYRPRIAEVIARDLGLETAELDPGVTGPLGLEAYEVFMRSNLNVLARYQGR